MYDKTLIKEKLRQIDMALGRIERRASSIQSADDFLESDNGLDMLDAIAMMLIAVGENFKKIDQTTHGELLSKYPNIHWTGLKGVRDVLSHQYFNIDAEEIFGFCSTELGPLRETVNRMLTDL